MVLVGVVKVIHKDERWLDLLDNVLDLLDGPPGQGDFGILVSSPEDLLGAKNATCRELLIPPHFRASPLGSIRQDHQVDPVARSRIFQQGPPAANFDIIRMGTQGYDVHTRLRRAFLSSSIPSRPQLNNKP